MGGSAASVRPEANRHRPDEVENRELRKLGVLSGDSTRLRVARALRASSRGSVQLSDQSPIVPGEDDLGLV